MNITELQRLVNQGFTAADLRSLGIIPAAQQAQAQQPQQAQQAQAQQPQQAQQAQAQQAQAQQEPAQQPQQAAPAPQPQPDPLAALSAKLDALAGIFQAAARQGVNTGGPARVIDPMETGVSALVKLSGYGSDQTTN